MTIQDTIPKWPVKYMNSWFHCQPEGKLWVGRYNGSEYLAICTPMSAISGTNDTRYYFRIKLKQKQHGTEQHI